MGAPPTYTDILARACALTVGEMPAVNVSYTEQGLMPRSVVGIGVAVNTDAGLIVPVLSQTETADLRKTSLALRDLTGRARNGRLRQSDLGPKSMVISNLGMYGMDTFIAIIDMPDPMILAVGRVAERVVPVAGQPAVLPMCTLTLSVDHRVLDGVQAAQFLDRLKNRLENPFDILG
jgi:pyruvate dehydrogenase E2 component (dihydrolipoamide acetyltransferase)